MSDAHSALDGAEFHGTATLRDMGLQGMITLRGDLSAIEVKNAATGVTGVDMPGLREINSVSGQGIAWMSPDELMVFVPYDAVADTLTTLNGALSGQHALAVNVSDARVLFSLTGQGAREALAKLAPIDLSPEVFQPGEIRRTRLAQVPAAVWMAGEDDFRIVAFRSVAQYVFDVLKGAAAPGSEVGYF